MNELQIFSNDQFGQIRTTVENGEPLFVLKDVCAVFGDQNYRRVSSRLDDDEKGVSQINTPGGIQNMVVVNEAGVYSALFAMQPEKARGVSDEYIEERAAQIKHFKRWITHEVIPTIRKTGGYVNDDAAFVATYLPNADEQTKALFQQTLATVRGLNSQIEEAKPKVLFADAVSASNTAILIGELAKILKQNGVEMGQNRLFEFLRKKGYLISRKGTDYNMPTQYSMERGWFRIKERAVQEPNGTTTVHKTPLVTGKGQQYFIDLFLHDIPWNL